MKAWFWLHVSALVLVVEVLTPTLFAADQDLVLHYRFDRDHADKVVDHSVHKNDGVNKFGQFVEEVRGRRGVMRFDGEKSVVQAESDSLILKGDFTYALQVRLNGIEKGPNCVLFGGSHYHFSLSRYLNLILVGYKRTPEGDNLSMLWPVDRDILVACPRFMYQVL